MLLMVVAGAVGWPPNGAGAPLSGNPPLIIMALGIAFYFLTRDPAPRREPAGVYRGGRNFRRARIGERRGTAGVSARTSCC